MRKPYWLAGVIALSLPAAVAAQDHDHGGGEPAHAAHAVTPKILPPARQIAEAVMAAPEEFRAGAQVLGYSPAGKLVELRKGTNAMICLADDPAEEPRWHVACYHSSLEAFMARGRELTAQGVSGAPRDSIRNADIVAGRIKMPPVGGLYTVTAEAGCFDAATGTLCKSAEPLHSVYVPFATPASTGLLDHPTDNHTPWLMNAGSPKAHIMFGKHQHH
jgi:hypothetical protein